MTQGKEINRRPLAPGYENKEGPNHFHDDSGDLIIDFTGNDPDEIHTQAKNQLQTSKVDPASGYPSHLIWTTKDGRRIPIPHMGDSHLQNTIAFLRRRVEPIYKKMLIAKIIQGIISNDRKLNEMEWMFGGNDHWEHFGESFFADMVKDANEDLKAQAREAYNLDTDAFLRKYHPQFPYLLQEAYRRKLIIEVDSGKLT